MTRLLRFASPVAAATLALAPAAIGFAAEPAPAGKEARAAAASWKRIKVPHHGALLLQVPESWRIEAFQPPNGLQQVGLGPKLAEKLPVIITSILPNDPVEPDRFLATMKMARDYQVRMAVDRKVPVLELRGEKTLGYYFTYALKKPDPKGGKHITSGSVQVEDLSLTFKIRTDAPEEHLVATALEILRTVKKEAATQEERLANPMPAQARLSLRGSPWVFHVDMPGFRTVLQQVRPDGSGATLEAENPDTHMSLSAFIEVSPRLDGAGACKEALWKRAEINSPQRTDIRELVNGDAIEVHYLTGTTQHQSHINAYRYVEGTCIDLHVMSSRTEAGDEARFRPLLDSARIDAKDEIEIMQDVLNH